MRSLPRQKPHSSNQVVGTPEEFLDAVERRFWPIAYDLAATAENRVVEAYNGPGSAVENSLADAWHLREGLLWLNPEYDDIRTWAGKTVTESELGAVVGMLTPSSTGAAWFRELVAPNAYVLELSPRLKFVGHKHPYPKDLIFSLFTPERLVGRAHWEWKKPWPIQRT